MKEFAGDNFKFNENGQEFSRRVKNIGGKGEIACYEQSLLFPQCFLQAYSSWKAQADDNYSVAQIMKFRLGRVETSISNNLFNPFPKK